MAWLTSEEPASLPAECVIKVAGDRITGRKPEEVTLVFYFSGHGDREGLHLEGERVPLADLQALRGRK